MIHLPHRHDRKDYGQLRLSPEAIKKCREAEAQSSYSPHAVVTQIVEAWARGFLWGLSKNRRWAGWGAVFGLAGLVLVRCVPLPVADPVMTKPMPESALPGQARPPCEKPAKEKVPGSCWLPVREDDGKQMRDCMASTVYFEDKDGLCWYPLYPKPARTPNSIGGEEEMR